MTTASHHAYASANAMRRVPQSGPAGFGECVMVLFRVRDRQRQRRALLDLDDHLLNDIGKTRREALDEARRPFWR